MVGIVLERSRASGPGDSGSERKLDREEMFGEDGTELPFSEDRLCRLYTAEEARWSWGRSGSSWKSRHDSRCRAIRDSRLSWGGRRVVGSGTMAPLGTVRRAEWKELRRLLGREVLHDTEREWDIDVCCELRRDLDV